jgi:hypothetical protein
MHIWAQMPPKKQCNKGTACDNSHCAFEHVKHEGKQQNQVLLVARPMDCPVIPIYNASSDVVDVTDQTRVFNATYVKVGSAE